MIRAGLDVRIGEVIRGYRLDNLIARGGMGAVYAATHESLRTRAAVKVLAPELARDRTYVARFLHEARIVNDVRHPNIIDVFDFAELDNPPRVAFVMELLQGPSLAAALSKGPLTPKQAFNVTLQLADALAAVHAMGVVHRDLKPLNAMLVADLSTDLSKIPSIKLLDFGIAKLPEEAAEFKTATGLMMGTPAYMAPEQIANTEISPATDLYALAEIVYEMLTGKKMFTGDNLQVLGAKLGAGAPPLEIPRNLFEGAPQITALLRASVVAQPDARPSLDDFRMAVQMIGESAGLIGETAPSAPKRDSQEDIATPRELDAVDPTFLKGSAYDDDEKDSQSLHGVTSLFLERIMEDFGELERETAEAAPPPAPPPPPEAPLDLMSEKDRQKHWPTARTESSAKPAETREPRPSETKPAQTRTPRPESVREPRPAQIRETTRQPVPFVPITVQPQAPTKIPIAVGVPEVPRAAFPWKPVAAGGIALMLLLGFGYLWLDDSHLDSTQPADDAVSKRQETWKDQHRPTESFDVLFDLAQGQHRRDTNAAYAAARAALEKALVVTPNEPRALALWAENEILWRGDLLTSNQLDEIDEFITLASQSAPDDGEVLRARAELERHRGEYATAAQLVARAINADPKDRRAIVTKAAVLMTSDAERALTVIEEAAAVPRSARVKAELLARLGRTHAALAALDAHPSAAKPDGALLLQRARILRDAGQIEPARAAARAAETETPCSARLLRATVEPPDEALAMYTAVAADLTCSGASRGEALAHLARTEIERRDAAKATALLDATPNEPLATLTSAEAALLGGDGAKARSIIEANAGSMGRPDLAATRAVAAATMNDHKGARAAIDVALARDGSSYELRLVEAALARLAADDLDEKLAALVDLDPLQDADRLDAIPVSNLTFSLLAGLLESASVGEKGWIPAAILSSMIYTYLGDVGQANDALSAARLVKPLPDTARIADGYVALGNNKGPDAEKIARGLLAVKPASGGGKLLLARALAMQGAPKAAAAEKAYLEAVKSLPRAPLAAAELRSIELLRAGKATPALVEKITGLGRDHQRSKAVKRVAFEVGL